MNIILATELTEKLTKLSFEINNLILLDKSKALMNPLSRQIVLASDIFSKPGLFLMSTSCLRFSDLEKYLCKANLLRENFSFLQRKTNNPKVISNRKIPYSLRKQILEVALIYEVFNYDRLSNGINNFVCHNFARFKFPHKKETHIFRHLEASYQFYLKSDKNKIKELLGHVDIQSQSSYIHNELIIYFSQN